MKVNAYLERTPKSLCTTVCQVEKVVELPTRTFDPFVYKPMSHWDFIAENQKLMKTKDGVDHCLLILGEDRIDGVLVNSEGTDTVRYAAHLPCARTILAAAVEQAANLIVKDGTENTCSGLWRQITDKLYQQTGLVVQPDNGIGPMLLAALQRRPEVAEAQLNNKVFELSFYQDYCKNLLPEMVPAESAVPPRSPARLVSNLLDFLSAHESSEDLYQMLHTELGFTNDEINSLGFELAHHYERETDMTTPQL